MRSVARLREVRMLAPHFTHAHLTRYTTSQRGAAAELLQEMWHAAGGETATASEAPDQALEAARAEAGAEGLVCVAGSVFLAGEVRALLEKA